MAILFKLGDCFIEIAEIMILLFIFLFYVISSDFALVCVWFYAEEEASKISEF